MIETGTIETRFFAVDPGSTESALVLYDPAARLIQLAVLEDNEAVLSRVRAYGHGGSGQDITLVVEQVASFGMPVGAEVFETVWWAGRFAEAWGRPSLRIKRLDVKLALCHDSRAKDANIRCALLDLFGGKAAAIGRKAAPGPLYGVRADLWAALAVAIVAADSHGRGLDKAADRK